MDSVITMIDRLNWQKLEHCSDNSCLCFMIMRQTHVPTNNILPTAPITATRLSHERNLQIPYARTDVCKYPLFYPYAASLWNKLPGTIKKLNHWILLNLI